ncbi:MAG: hypothetical protein ACOY42_02105 [Pseudomonadota bacterium]
MSDIWVEAEIGGLVAAMHAQGLSPETIVALVVCALVDAVHDLPGAQESVEGDVADEL